MDDGRTETRGRQPRRGNGPSESRSNNASTGSRAPRRALEFRAPSTDRNARFDRQLTISKASRTPQRALEHRAPSTDSNARLDRQLTSTVSRTLQHAQDDRAPATDGAGHEQSESRESPPQPPAVQSAFDDDDEHDAEKGEKRDTRSAIRSKHSCCGSTRVRCASSYRKSRWCACCRWSARPHVKYTLQIMAACTLMALSIFFSSFFELTDDSWHWKTQFTVSLLFHRVLSSRCFLEEWEP